MQGKRINFERRMYARLSLFPVDHDFLFAGAATRQIHTIARHRTHIRIQAPIAELLIRI
jgi:hypothetical protein